MLAISTELTAYVTIGATILTVYITYLTEHHDSSSKQLEMMQATTRQQLELKTDQLHELEKQINDLKVKNEELKKQYESRIESLKKEVAFLKQKNADLQRKIEKKRGK